MKSTDKNLFACERQAVTDVEMREIDESLKIDRPIENKAISEAKQAVYWTRVWVGANIIGLIMVAYVVYKIWLGA